MIKPFGSRLYVERIIESATTKDGEVTFTDDDFKAPASLKVKVLALGPDVSSDMKIGDTLMVSQFAPTEIKENPGDINRYMLPAEDVLGIVVPDKVAE